MSDRESGELFDEDDGSISVSTISSLDEGEILSDDEEDFESLLVSLNFSNPNKVVEKSEVTWLNALKNNKERITSLKSQKSLEKDLENKKYNQSLLNMEDLYNNSFIDKQEQLCDTQVDDDNNASDEDCFNKYNLIPKRFDPLIEYYLFAVEDGLNWRLLPSDITEIADWQKAENKDQSLANNLNKNTTKVKTSNNRNNSRGKASEYDNESVSSQASYASSKSNQYSRNNYKPRNQSNYNWDKNRRNTYNHSGRGRDNNFRSHNRGRFGSDLSNSGSPVKHQYQQQSNWKTNAPRSSARSNSRFNSNSYSKNNFDRSSSESSAKSVSVHRSIASKNADSSPHSLEAVVYDSPRLSRQHSEEIITEYSSNLPDQRQSQVSRNTPSKVKRSLADSASDLKVSDKKNYHSRSAFMDKNRSSLDDENQVSSSTNLPEENDGARSFFGSSAQPRQEIRMQIHNNRNRRNVGVSALHSANSAAETSKSNEPYRLSFVPPHSSPIKPVIRAISPNTIEAQLNRDEEYPSPQKLRSNREGSSEDRGDGGGSLYSIANDALKKNFGYDMVNSLSQKHSKLSSRFKKVPDDPRMVSLKSYKNGRVMGLNDSPSQDDNSPRKDGYSSRMTSSSKGRTRSPDRKRPRPNNSNSYSKSGRAYSPNSRRSRERFRGADDLDADASSSRQFSESNRSHRYGNNRERNMDNSEDTFSRHHNTKGSNYRQNFGDNSKFQRSSRSGINQADSNSSSRRSRNFEKNRDGTPESSSYGLKKPRYSCDEFSRSRSKRSQNNSTSDGPSTGSRSQDPKSNEKSREELLERLAEVEKTITRQREQIKHNNTQPSCSKSMS